MERTEPCYEVLRPLGAGASGRVDLVRLREPFAGLPIGAELALKTFAAAPGEEAAARNAFAAEAAAAAEVRAATLVRVLHQGERAGEPYLLLQYVPGRTLREVLAQEGPLPEPRLRAVGADLAHALAALHARGLVHGDVKPENVRLDEEGQAVLLDLGFAHKARAVVAGRTGGGSLAYLSPERVRGEPAGPAADMFALGIVLYELGTGMHPFDPKRTKTRLLGRASTSGAIARRSLELVGADELLAAIATGRFPAPSRLAPSLSPFLDRCLTEVLARSPLERPAAAELETRFRQGERGDWWSACPDLAEREAVADGEGWPLVGRERELAQLIALYDQLLASPEARARVVWLVGPEGSGKWRLLRSFAERVRAGVAPPVVLDARWNETDEGRPAGATLMLLNRWLGLPAGRAPRARDTARLTELLGAASARALLGALDPHESGSEDRSIPGELARWLGKLAEQRVVLVFLDDLHQAGPVTLSSLSSLLELLRGARVLFVAALREDVAAAEPEQLARSRERLERGAEDDGPHAGPLFHRLELEPLSPAAVRELVERVFHEAAPRERLAEVLWEKSRGNPGFLTEILRELEARGGAHPHDDEDPRWDLVVAPEDVPTPRSLDRLIRERIALLEPDERTWLERLSIVEGRILPEFLQQAFPPARRIEVDDVLARLARKGWLVPAADRYRFERPGLREMLYRAIPAPRRRRLHAAAARGLAADHADLEEAYQRAFHLHAAGEHAELHETVRAILPALRRRASAQRLATLARWGLEALEHLGELPEREKGRLELLEDAADAADRLGNRTDQRELLDHLANFELDPERQPREAARLYLLHARYAASTGQFGLARGWLKTAAGLAERSKDDWLVSQAQRRLAQVQAQVGEFRDARKLARRALKTARGENQEALARLALAHVDVLEDEIEAALSGIDAALAALAKTSEPRAGVLAYAELLRGRTLRSSGLTTKATAAIQRAIVLARRAGERRLEAEARARLGGLWLDCDRPAEARAELKGALLLSDEIEDRRGQVLSMLWLGQLEAELGEPGARERFERAHAQAGEIAFYRAEAVALTGLARLAHDSGESEQALRDSGRALELVERHGAELVDRIGIVGTRALLARAARRAAEAELLLAELARRTRASQRRIRSSELRAARKEFVERLLAEVLGERARGETG